MALVDGGDQMLVALDEEIEERVRHRQVGRAVIQCDGGQPLGLGELQPEDAGRVEALVHEDAVYGLFAQPLHEPIELRALLWCGEALVEQEMAWYAYDGHAVLFCDSWVVL